MLKKGNLKGLQLSRVTFIPPSFRASLTVIEASLNNIHKKKLAKRE
jgi:hypothetical protein